MDTQTFLSFSDELQKVGTAPVVNTALGLRRAQLMVERALDVEGKESKKETRKAVRELDKLAYGPDQHTELMDQTMKQWGAGKGVRDMAVGGTLGADKGIRHPWLPTSDKLHAMPTRTKKEVAQEMMRHRQRAIQDVAHGIANPGRRGNVRLSRGMQGLGQAQHTVMDIGAHYEKPTEAMGRGRAGKQIQGAANWTRDKLQKVPGMGPAGFVVSGAEHAASGGAMRGIKGVLGIGEGGVANLDELHPQSFGADRRSLGRARGFGRASRRHIIKELVDVHGMNPQQAEAAFAKAMQQGAPGRAAQRAGALSGNLRYMKTQLGRPLRRLLRR